MKMEIEIDRIDNTTVQDQMATQHRLAKKWKDREEEEWVRHNKLNRNIFSKS